MNKVRESRFELLRIFSMLIIIICHYSTHGMISAKDTNVSSKIILEVFRIGGNLGNNLFILLAGYFGIKSTFSLNKVKKIWILVAGYSLTLYLITVIFNYQKLGVMQLIKCVFPVSFSEYWFFSFYIILYILSPYINKMLKCLEKKEFQKLIIVLFLILCIWPSCFHITQMYHLLLWFIFVYIVGAYMMLWINFRKFSCEQLIGIIIFTLALIIFSIVFFNVFAGGKLSKYSAHFTNLNSLMQFSLAISLFEAFYRIQLKSEVINIIASGVFGIYLIHDNQYIREILWGQLFNNAQYENRGGVLIIHALFSTGMVFIICEAIELSRNKIFIKLIKRKRKNEV